MKLAIGDKVIFEHDGLFCSGRVSYTQHIENRTALQDHARVEVDDNTHNLVSIEASQDYFKKLA
jgi:hypothetical protein